MDESRLQDEELWRQFEWLSQHYISSRLNVKIKGDDFKLTEKRKDGGFDGQLIIDVTSDEEVCHKILFESKFRTSIKSLPLADCAKALIIAFNQAAQTLYIVTNVLFSPQAQEEIIKFKKKVNFIVIAVDGTALKKYVIENRTTLRKQCSEEFLRYIETSPEVDINIKINDLNEGVKKETSKLQDRSICNLGIASKEYLYKSNFFETESKEYIKNIKSTSKFTLLSGEAGVGKTVFLTETLNTLEEQGYSVTIFDLQQCTTPRDFFIKLLESLWDIDLSEFISQFDFEEGIENLRPLIEYNSDGEINENLLSAVTQAICKRTEEIKGYTDNYYSCLIRHIRSSITISILHHIDRQNITVIIEFFTSFLSIAMLTASPAAAPISTPPTPVVAVPAAVPAVAAAAFAAAFAVSFAACVR